MATKDQTYSFLTAPKNPNELGMLGSYRVIDELGRGGMGFVFRAEDTRLQRSVALKVMNEKIAATKNSRTRFISEARAMAAVHHDNVATIFEVGEKNGTPFMAMEILQGETLEAYKLRKERPGFEEVIEIATQIARGLAAAHNKGIVHRDIKPANIWIEAGSGRVKILDFGLALAQTPVDQLAGRGSVIGTPGYLSPEQARSEPLDNRSDLYSLGVVLYELCTTRLPLQAKTVAGQLIAILAHDPRPLRNYNPDIPAPLADLILRLLSREPQDRPRSAEALEEELRIVSDECHAKSEVAMALDKLQAGLSEVVSKTHDSSGLDALSGSSMMPTDDPFASIPDTPVAAGPSASSGSSGSIPAVANYANPYAKPAAPKPAAKSGFNWQSHWPFVALSAVALVAIPIVVAWLLMGGDTSTTVTVTAGGVPVTTNKRAANPQDTREKNANANNANKNQGNNRGGGNAKSGNKNVGAGGNKSGGKNAGGRPQNRNQKQFTLRTSDGRGADAVVAFSLKTPQGDATTMAIRENLKRPKDSRHAYLRFDLASIPCKREEIETVRLTIPIAGTVRPANTSLKVHGVTDELPEVWDESGANGLVWAKTPSKNKFASLAVLAETKVTAERDPADGKRNVVHLESPDLAKFLRDSKSELITLAISCTTGEEKPLRVSTKENKDGEVVPNRGPALSIKMKKKGG